MVQKKLVLGLRNITLHIGLLGTRFVSEGTILKSTKLSKIYPITLTMVSIPLLVFRISIGGEECYNQQVLLKAGSYPNEGSILLLLVT
jgi:hypothetical protein